MEGRKRVEKNTAQKVKDKAQKVDLSGMSLNSLSNPPAMELLCITKLDLSNNNQANSACFSDSEFLHHLMDRVQVLMRSLHVLINDENRAAGFGVL